jgi:NitT/TauT family transport system permease protein
VTGRSRALGSPGVRGRPAASAGARAGSETAFEWEEGSSMNPSTITARKVGRTLLLTGTVMWAVTYGLITSGWYKADLATACGYWTAVTCAGGLVPLAARLARGKPRHERDAPHEGPQGAAAEGAELRQSGIFRRPIARRWQVALGIASFVSLAGAYTLASHVQHRKNPYDRSLPTWSELFHDGVVQPLTERYSPSEDVELYSSLGAGGLSRFPRILMEPFLTDRYDVLVWVDAKATLIRLAVGLFLGSTISLVLGLLMGCYPFLASYCLPPMFFLSKIPATAILAIFFVAVGTDFRMYVTMIAFGMIPVLTQTVYHSAKEDVPEELISKAYTLGASQAECIWDVIFKYVLPKVLESTRIQFGPAMVYLIAAEMLVGQVGFGYRIKINWRISNMSAVYVYCAYLGIIGMLIDSTLIRFQRLICPWYER